MTHAYFVTGTDTRLGMRSRQDHLGIGFD